MSDDPNDILHEKVSRIAELPDGPRRDALVEAFLADYDGMFVFIGNNVANRLVLGHTGRDEIIQLVRVEAWNMLNEANENGAVVHNWPAMLTVRSRRVSQRYLDGTEASGVTGMSSRQRRARSLKRVRESMYRATGVVPDDQAVVDEHNRQMIESRADAKREGVIASVDDMRPMTAASIDELGDGAIVTEGVLETVAGNDLVRHVIETANGEDPVLGRVAQAFLGGHLSEPGQIEDRVSYIARSASVPVAMARTMMARVRQIALDILDETNNDAI